VAGAGGAGEIPALVCAWVTLRGIHESGSGPTLWAALTGNPSLPVGDTCMGRFHSELMSADRREGQIA